MDKYRYCGIYLIQIGNYNYVGQSINILSRVHQHKKLLKNNKHHNSYMQNVYNKYPSFSYKILWQGELQFLTIMEQCFINKFNYSLNIKGAKKRGPLSKEHKLNISKANKTSLAVKESLSKAIAIAQAKPNTNKQIEASKQNVKSCHTKQVIAKSAASRKDNPNVIQARRTRKDVDQTIYTIQNKQTKEIFVGLRADFAKVNSVSSSRTSDLVKRGYYKQWFITHKDHSPV